MEQHQYTITTLNHMGSRVFIGSGVTRDPNGMLADVCRQAQEQERTLYFKVVGRHFICTPNGRFVEEVKR